MNVCMHLVKDVIRVYVTRAPDKVGRPVLAQSVLQTLHTQSKWPAVCPCNLQSIASGEGCTLELSADLTYIYTMYHICIATCETRGREPFSSR